MWQRIRKIEKIEGGGEMEWKRKRERSKEVVRGKWHIVREKQREK